jgi:hypothetical protein
VCLPFILARGLLWFLPEQSRMNGRDTGFRSVPVKQ